jgi:alkylhydroperoxidase/carboxymuconolactone decarboxylase family protein YurZ
VTQPASWQDLLKSGAPDILKVSEDARDAILPDGALSNKTKTLMTMLCDALLGHDGGVTTIANRARAAGASEEEIAETVGVAFLMGGLPALVTGANAFKK